MEVVFTSGEKDDIARVPVDTAEWSFATPCRVSCGRSACSDRSRADYDAVLEAVIRTLARGRFR
ncbi:hypothetical protein MAUB1S_00530 [Mycolicibacterium aubagnense]